MDNPNDIPILKVRDYEDMYIVRPAYMIVLLNMITSLTLNFKDLLIDLFDGKQFKRADAIKIIIEYHKQNGGKLQKNEYISVFKKATQMLNGQGLVNNAYGIWTLNYEKPEIEIFEVEEPTVKNVMKFMKNTEKFNKK